MQENKRKLSSMLGGKVLLACTRLPPGKSWFQAHSKNWWDAVGCAANKSGRHRSGASPFPDADALGDGIHDYTVVEAKWSGDRIAQRRQIVGWWERKKRSEQIPWLGHVELTLQAFDATEQRAKDNNWVPSEDLDSLIQHLDGMRIFHHRAIVDQEYMKNCYSQADQTRNGGWLSLVSKDYFEFGKVLLSQIRDKVQQKEWGRNGNASIKVAAEPICKDATIKKAFFDACTGSSTPVSVLQSLLDRLVLKVFHARAGASMEAWKRKKHSKGSERLGWCLVASWPKVEGVAGDQEGRRIPDAETRRQRGDSDWWRFSKENQANTKTIKGGDKGCRVGSLMEEIMQIMRNE